MDIGEACHSAPHELTTIAFDPRGSSKELNTGQISFFSGTTFVGNPGCATGSGGTGSGGSVAVCAVVNSSNSLLGVGFDPRTQTPYGPFTLAAGPFVGSPACAAPLTPTISGTVICTFVLEASNTLEAVAFNPVTGSVSAVQTLPLPPSGIWSGNIGCAPSNDSPAHGNEIVCAATTSTNEVFGVELDPIAVVGTVGPSAAFSTSGTLDGAPSCVRLNIDANVVACGILTTVSSTESSTGFLVPM